MTQFLVFDNCFDSFSVAVGTKEKVLKEKKSTSNDGFMFLSKYIKDILGNTEIDGVITTLGPGSFTGIRIGIATALGISVPKNIGCFGISTFDLILLQAILENRIDNKYLENDSNEYGIMVLLDSKRSKLCYYKKYQYQEVHEIYAYCNSNLQNSRQGTLHDQIQGTSGIDDLMLNHNGIIITNIKNLRDHQTKNVRNLSLSANSKIEEIILIDEIEAKSILKAPAMLLTDNMKPIYS